MTANNNRQTTTFGHIELLSTANNYNIFSIVVKYECANASSYDGHDGENKHFKTSLTCLFTSGAIGRVTRTPRSAGAASTSTPSPTTATGPSPPSATADQCCEEGYILYICFYVDTVKSVHQ